MSATVGKVASAASKAASSAASKGPAGAGQLHKGAKRDPELYVLLGVMSGAFGLAGFYFGRKPTSATSEANVAMAPNSMPWQRETTDGDEARADFKYSYHPAGNPKNPPKDAPSALHSVIVPKVNLPKELHEKYNKWGKDGY
ncbi:hypothetical protein GLAREA_10879 [Glarea lozoyensis ATCC 20868]|uniref:Uncharacterized protein n=2 Tax=Glarea lozoyensis TaxID=101852 RepID=S3EA23_GLAL2|nr:uncharacterized protein GLAREA_10879 [Glarea lozoyensis ATCC 20868]EHK96453.1 hypothetical protein M7I_7848 [Glarea lozoyensis 74030]EPE35183.1 hypothetical protein GLAREA_10879 [Glarea lozoyensis ATCC 20868]